MHWSPFIYLAIITSSSTLLIADASTEILPAAVEPVRVRAKYRGLTAYKEKFKQYIAGYSTNYLMAQLKVSLGVDNVTLVTSKCNMLRHFLEASVEFNNENEDLFYDCKNFLSKKTVHSAREKLSSILESNKQQPYVLLRGFIIETNLHPNSGMVNFNAAIRRACTTNMLHCIIGNTFEQVLVNETSDSRLYREEELRFLQAGPKFIQSFEKPPATFISWDPSSDYSSTEEPTTVLPIADSLSADHDVSDDAVASSDDDDNINNASSNGKSVPFAMTLLSFVLHLQRFLQ